MTNETVNDELERALRGLQPAASQIDESTLFFAAGYRAAVADRSTPKVKQWLALTCAALFGGVIMAPASYHWGSSTQAKSTESKIPSPQPVLAETIVDSGAASAQELTTAAPTDGGSEDEGKVHHNLLVTLAARWLMPPADDSRNTSLTLTASHSSALKQADFQRRLAGLPIEIDYRYRTFSTAVSDQSDDARILSVRDTNAMTMGDL